MKTACHQIMYFKECFLSLLLSSHSICNCIKHPADWHPCHFITGNSPMSIFWKDTTSFCFSNFHINQLFFKKKKSMEKNIFVCDTLARSLCSFVFSTEWLQLSELKMSKFRLKKLFEDLLRPSLLGPFYPSGCESPSIVPTSSSISWTWKCIIWSSPQDRLNRLKSAASINVGWCARFF